MDEATVAVLAAGAAVAGAQAVTGLSPRPFEVAQTTPGTPVAAAMRHGQLAGAVLALSIGGVSSLLARSWWPMALTLAVAGAVALYYEVLLRRHPGGG